MPDERLHIFNDPNIHVNRAQWYNQLFEAYAWHFKIKNRPATKDELARFAQWHGMKNKEPDKKQIVDFFLDQKITF
jgi:hypothetical protein